MNKKIGPFMSSLIIVTYVSVGPAAPRMIEPHPRAAIQEREARDQRDHSDPRKIDNERPFSEKDRNVTPLRGREKFPFVVSRSFKLRALSLIDLITSYYAPLSVKIESVGLDWRETARAFMREAGQLKTTIEEIFSISRLLNSLHDAHVSLEIPSDYAQLLPMQMSYVDGKIIVNFLDGDFPKGNDGKPIIGLHDEVIKINDKTPEEINALLRPYYAFGNEFTDAGMFPRLLSRLREGRGIPIVDLNWSELKLTLKRDDGSTYDAVVPYQSSGTSLIGRDIDGTDPVPPPVIAKKQANNRHTIEGPDHLPQGIVHISELMKKLLKSDANVGEFKKRNNPLFFAPKEGAVGQKIELGIREPFFKLPEDFKEIKVNLPLSPPALEALRKQLNGDFFFAGTFMRDGKRVGFLRIPSYEPEQEATMLHSLRFYISKLQEQSDVLIFDQTNNPGGMVAFSDMVVKSFTGSYNYDKHLTFRVRPSQHFLRTFAGLRQAVYENADNTFTPQEVEYFTKRLDTEYMKVKKAYDANINSSEKLGENLSEPVSFLVISEYLEKALEKNIKNQFPFFGDPMFIKALGADLTQPAVYTKPVYMLINEYDFSGGDATPASLKDYGRVTLVGFRTAGAGATVEEIPVQSIFDGLTVHLSTGIMWRYNGDHIENKGVPEDIKIVPNLADYKDGFSNFLNRVLMTAVDFKQIPNAPVAPTPQKSFLLQIFGFLRSTLK